ncbi:uncharacterized protein [Physcomitrium patens]|uniref:RNA polymerase sigma factor n=1 Tax=Physcomitrium patens TaxID=3218 RepID=A0A2K1LB70_PHYPA|nr:uncharacterized protein LOC112274899 [Physcomitrium patens]PNR63278.1 hypothetical protein PHYPA_001703 [Physcomitrium patens]|eukprot:XP_024360553.1 uncharacterized protein LOC112274899 [Physcomitrella patens]
MTASSAWGVQLPSDGRGVVTVALRGQDCNPASCSGRKDGWVEGAGGSTRATQRRIASGRVKLSSAWLRSVSLVSLSVFPTKRAVCNRNLKVCNVLVTKSWLGSKNDVSRAAADEAMALALAAVRAARDAASYADAMVVENEEAPSELDKLSLERARLNDMEHSFRVGYAAEDVMPEAEPSYVQKLESLMEGASTLDREAEGAASPRADAEFRNSETADGLPQTMDFNVAVKSKRKKERMRKRERALEKAEKTASALASAPPVPKPKKLQIMRTPSDPIRSYLRDIKRTKLLSASEEVALSRKIQDILKLEKIRAELQRDIGREPTLSEWSQAVSLDQTSLELRVKEGRSAKDKLVNSNLRLVVSIVKNYQGRGMTLPDLIQEGSLGLIRGAEKFDPEMGYKFSTYATWWIRQAVTRAIADQSRIIRLPVHIYEVISRINKAKMTISQELGRQPRDEEVAAMVGMSVEKLLFIVKSARPPTSMDRPIGKDGEQSLGEMVADKGVGSPEDDIMTQVLKQDIEDVLRSLNPMEREVLRLRFGLSGAQSMTLKDLGIIFKVTRERIRQIEAKALRKLRHPSWKTLLQDHVKDFL